MKGRKVLKKIAKIGSMGLYDELVSMKRELHRVSESLEHLEKVSKGQQKSLQELSEENTSLFSALLRGSDGWLLKNQNKYAGERCFLLGCGPSLKNTDLSLLKDEFVMGVNGTYLIEELSLDFFCSVSHVFWKDHVEGIRDIDCERLFLPYWLEESIQPQKTGVSWLNGIQHSDYKRFSSERPLEFSREASKSVFLGGSVIFVCLQILFQLGFEEVVLLGVDHDYGIDPKSMPQNGVVVDSKNLSTHFTDNYYPQDTQVHIDIHSSERAYSMAANAFSDVGRKVLNATPGTKLEVFPKINLEDCFQ